MKFEKYDYILKEIYFLDLQKYEIFCIFIIEEKDTLEEIIIKGRCQLCIDIIINNISNYVIKSITFCIDGVISDSDSKILIKTFSNNDKYKYLKKYFNKNGKILSTLHFEQSNDWKDEIEMLIKGDLK